MSKWNGYAKKVRELAAVSFDKYRLAKERFDAAEKKRLSVTGNAAEDAQRQADALKALQQVKDAVVFMEQQREYMAGELRSKLEADLKGRYNIKPKDMNEADIAILKSGILSADEYASWYNEAVGSENYTMARFIKKYAGQAAEDIEKAAGKTDESRKLHDLSIAPLDTDSETVLNAYDGIVQIYSYALGSARNGDGSFINNFESFTSEAIANF